MHRLISFQALIIPAAMTMCGAVAQAQFGPPGGPYQPEAVNSLVERVHTDLDHAYDRWHLKGDERHRLNKAEKELREFAGDWRNGKFDKGELDDSIGAIQHVLNENRLAGPERDALSGDETQLREMRDAYNHHEIGRW